jgi:hypothetical protein
MGAFSVTAGRGVRPDAELFTAEDAKDAEEYERSRTSLSG